MKVKFKFKNFEDHSKYNTGLLSINTFGSGALDFDIKKLFESEPFEIFAKKGIDGVREYLISSLIYLDNIEFDQDDVNILYSKYRKLHDNK